MRGTKAITREIKILNSRKSDDPFIEGINDLKQEYSYLENIEFDDKKIKPARIDQPAMIP